VCKYTCSHTLTRTDGRTETQTEVTHSPILISAHLSVSTLAAAAAFEPLCTHPTLHTTSPLAVRLCFYLIGILYTLLLLRQRHSPTPLSPHSPRSLALVIRIIYTDIALLSTDYNGTQQYCLCSQVHAILL